MTTNPFLVRPIIVRIGRLGRRAALRPIGARAPGQPRRSSRCSPVLGRLHRRVFRHGGREFHAYRRAALVASALRGRRRVGAGVFRSNGNEGRIWNRGGLREGKWHWRQPGKFRMAVGGPGGLTYPDRASAERELENVGTEYPGIDPTTFAVVEAAPDKESRFLSLAERHIEESRKGLRSPRRTKSSRRCPGRKIHARVSLVPLGV
jgi:hypothetical protein